MFKKQPFEQRDIVLFFGVRWVLWWSVVHGAWARRRWRLRWQSLCGTDFIEMICNIGLMPVNYSVRALLLNWNCSEIIRLCYSGVHRISSAHLWVANSWLDASFFQCTIMITKLFSVFKGHCPQPPYLRGRISCPPPQGHANQLGRT